MINGNRQLAQALKSLLNEKLSQAEEQSLKDEGFILKNPTRKAAVMIALYKKAASGDLSAIKEVRSIVTEGATDDSGKGTAVMIVDDIANKSF